MDHHEHRHCVDKSYIDDLTVIAACRTETLVITTGESSFGGVGFLMVNTENAPVPEWIIVESAFNNPVSVGLDHSWIELITDAPYPMGTCFRFPIHNPRHGYWRMNDGDDAPQ